MEGDDEVRLLGADQLELTVNGLALRLDRQDAVRLMIRVLSTLGWQASEQKGLAGSGVTQPMSSDRELRDQQEKLRANAVQGVTVVQRPVLTGPWAQESLDLDTSAQPAKTPERRFTKETPGPARPAARATRKQSRVAERQPGDPTIEVTLFSDPEEQLRYEVMHWYLVTVPTGQREEWPLRAYSFGPRFLSDVAEQTGQISRGQIVSAIVDVVCTRAQALNSRRPRQLRAGESAGDHRSITRSDGSVAWRANISHGTPAARRIMWWALPSGEVELARLAVHDDVEMP